MIFFKSFASFTCLSLFSLNCAPDIGTGPQDEEETDIVTHEPIQPQSVQLDVTPKDIQVGVLAPGETSDTYTITLQSMSAESDEIAIVTDEQVNILTTDCEGIRLKKGESCTAELVVEMTDKTFESSEIKITDGNHSVQVNLHSQNTDTEPQTNLKPSISPASHNFGRIYKHMSRTQTFTVENKSSSNLGPLRTRVSAYPFRLGDDGCKGITLSSGETCTVKVIFTPPGEYNYSESLFVSSETVGVSAQLIGSGDEDG